MFIPGFIFFFLVEDVAVWSDGSLASSSVYPRQNSRGPIKTRRSLARLTVVPKKNYKWLSSYGIVYCNRHSCSCMRNTSHIHRLFPTKIVTKGLSTKDKSLPLLYFLKAVLEMPFCTNTDRQHEKAVETLLKKYNVRYEAQPNGPQQFPDFKVQVGTYTLDIECKSTKQHKPMWNCAAPVGSAIYILTSKQKDRTTLFLGKDVCPRETYNRLIEDKQFIKKKINEYNENHDDGWNIYPRLAFDNRGKKTPNYWNTDFPSGVLTHVRELISKTSPRRC